MTAAFNEMPLIVKNTFFCVQDLAHQTEETSSRRRRSVPASLRLCSATKPEDDKASVSTTDDRLEELSSRKSTASAETSRSGRSKLTSEAEAWEPSTGQDALFQEFLQEASQIVMSAQAAVEADGRASFVQAMTSWEGMCLRIFVPRACDDILEVAKAALLSAADLSSNTYVLGYGGNPFVLQQHGFSASMGALRDESKACWETYRYGLCRRGCQCRWEHPPFVASVSVTVEVADVSAFAPAMPMWQTFAQPMV